MIINIRNDFHNTQVRVRAEVGDTLSARVTARVQRELCGRVTCCCAGAIGRQDGFIVVRDYDSDGHETLFIANEWMI